MLQHKLHVTKGLHQRDHLQLQISRSGEELANLIACPMIVSSKKRELSLPREHVLPLYKQPSGSPLLEQWKKLNQVLGPWWTSFHIDVHWKAKGALTFTVILRHSR